MFFRNFSYIHQADLICKDEEYYSLVSDILEHKEVLKMKDFIQHGQTNCYEHCLNVSYYSYLICKKLGLDAKSAARGGMLHDLFLYDWHLQDSSNVPLFKKHAFSHPYIALKNAKKYFNLNRKEKDIIVKHMWPVTIILPKYKESYIITLVDKICCVAETVYTAIPQKIYI